ncbi:YfcE family phosphodiesterase [Halobellus sp. GM3]|uniref:YfcE family phosphodiesterase n=1 Tax=Halobellus sp. GM3 TaxID=3458410 RepID=UPI00403DF126
MRIGLLSDVHANAPALKAVLNDMPPVDKLVHAGDLIGYGAFPQTVIELFQHHEITSIRGNHEVGILDGFSDPPRIPEVCFEWTRSQLNEDHLEYLDALPVEIDLLDSQVHVAHGAPDSPREYTFPSDFSPSLVDDERVLVLGHTHVQAVRSFEDSTIVNPGSVGLPRDGDPRAAYALLDCEEWEVGLRRVSYDIEQAQEALRQNELPEELIDGLENGELLFGRTKTAYEKSQYK